MRLESFFPHVFDKVKVNENEMMCTTAATFLTSHACLVEVGIGFLSHLNVTIKADQYFNYSY